MSKSTARRKREHQLRNQGKDVSMARNGTNFSTYVRMTKTKNEKLQKQYSKYKKHFTKGITPDGNAFYYVLQLTYTSVRERLKLIRERMPAIRETNGYTRGNYIRTRENACYTREIQVHTREPRPHQLKR
ncbi:hypothetical protein [Psychrobacillus antarcticus]|uniref:hypothetical protein n=1 Tax=Psychrobacillus antarcticus TaxID=2879115 RepID=UPI002407E7CD|nr:hypothetical protein [Psychrobacillus antarcticus]